MSIPNTTPPGEETVAARQGRAPGVAEEQAEAAAQSKSGLAGTGRIRLVAILIGMAIIPFNALWVISMEKVNIGPYPTVISIFINSLFILAIIIALNSLVRRWRPRWALSMAEMLLIYTMVTIASALCGHDMIPTLVATMGYPWWAANDTNQYATFLPHLPKWLSVTDLTVLKPMFEGDASLYAQGRWLVWLTPSLLWASFMAVLVFVMQCVNVLVRKQWTENERLTFPIVQLPIAMTEPKGIIWKSKLFWIAFSICFGVELINGLSVYFPRVPMFDFTERTHNLAAGLTALPWKAVGWVPYTFYPFVIGLGYLLPLDLNFSVWFFFLFWKFEKIVAAMFGMDVTWDDPYISYQSFGGVIAIVTVLLWTSRGHIKQIWRRVIGAESQVDDSGEPISYRAAVLGALGGLLLMMLFLRKIGMSPLVVLLVFIVYFAFAIVITRIRAELGPPVHDMPFGPGRTIPELGGIGRFSQGDLVGMAYFTAFHGASRAHPMPIGLEGMKMAQTTQASQRKFFWAIVIAAVLGSVATFWAYLHLAYARGLEKDWHYGAAWAWEICKELNGFFHPNPQTAAPNWAANGAVGVGFGFCLLLSIIRMRCFNWPFNPIGFVISGSYQVHIVWVPLLIAWLAKSTILKYGGLRVYRQALPFFLGLILGELTMGCLWGVIGMLFHIPYYNFFGA